MSDLELEGVEKQLMPLKKRTVDFQKLMVRKSLTMQQLTLRKVAPKQASVPKTKVWYDQRNDGCC